jgi:hypothetical protein
MGELQRNLTALIGVRSVPLSIVCPAGIIRSISGSPALSTSISSCMSALRGTGIPGGPKGFDLLFTISMTPGFKSPPGVSYLAIELDEEQHFNRYRTVTLSCPEYLRMPWFPLSPYQNYSLTFEPLCLAKASYLGYWSTIGSVRIFGPPGPKVVLTGSGSPRWKQRAYYDYLRDILPLACPVLRVARLSIYDNIGASGSCVPLSLAPKSRANARIYKSQIYNLINSRY